jgi:hypothetical protein
MTNRKHLEFGFIVLAAFALLSNASTSYSQPANSRLIISFTSQASGIDREAKREIDGFITEYEKEKGRRLAKEIVRWGREGELDYCFMLSELSQGDQAHFVSQIKLLVKKSKQTSVVENAPCRNKEPK